MLDPDKCLRGFESREPQVVPDLPSINALSQTNTTFHQTLDQLLYDLCANVEPLGKLALLFAVKHQLESTVDKLVAVGVSLNAEFKYNHDNCSLLHIASSMGLQAMVVKLLGMYGEEKMTRVHARRGGDDRTALDYAAYCGHMDIVKLLAPIPFPAPIPNTGRGLHAAQETRTRYLSLALVEAIVAQKSEISQYLISEGADVNFGPTGSTPLVCAIGTENVGLVQLLLASGADPNFGIPIFIAVRTPNIDIVRALVDGGADIHVQHNRRNILSYCANIELLRFFLERGVDPNTEDDPGWTALHLACRKTSEAKASAEYAKASVELLLQFGAGPVDRDNPSGYTAVDVAMYAGYSEIVKIMEPLVQDPTLQAKIAKWWEKRNGGSIS